MCTPRGTYQARDCSRGPRALCVQSRHFQDRAYSRKHCNDLLGGCVPVPMPAVIARHYTHAVCKFIFTIASAEDTSIPSRPHRCAANLHDRRSAVMSWRYRRRFYDASNYIADSSPAILGPFLDRRRGAGVAKGMTQSGNES